MPSSSVGEVTNAALMEKLIKEVMLSSVDRRLRIDLGVLVMVGVFCPRRLPCRFNDLTSRYPPGNTIPTMPKIIPTIVI